MKKSSFVSLALAIVLLAAALPIRADAANAAAFPLPTTSTYTVSALSNYSGGARHSSYLYTYGPMRSAAYDPYCLADIPAPRGTPIYAVADGVVLTNTYGSGGGYYLVLRHSDSTYSYYGHMRAQSSLPVGTSVRAGAILGYVGMTGTATGYHLHFEWSGHDPYCEYAARGYITGRTLAAAVYPHQHSGTGGTGTVNTASCAVTTGAADTITQTSAVLRGSVSASGVKVNECGVFLGTSRTNMQKLGSDTINTYGTSFYYSTAKYGQPLTAGTTYYYQAYAQTGNTTYYGDICTFRTLDASAVNSQPSATVKSSGATNVTISSAQLNGSVSTLGNAHIQETGAYLGTSASNMTLLGKDAVNNRIGSLSMWYGTEKYGRTLQPDTTYYYYCYAVVDGKTVNGSVASFRTQSSGNWYYAYANVPTGTQHLAINSKASAGSQIGRIPHGGQVKVYPGRSSGNWLWVEYNGVSGYSYKNYLVTSKP